MTKPGYTHVLIPKSLHSILKEKSEQLNISVGKYIERLIESESDVLKTGGALRHRSSNLLLSALIFKDYSIKNEPKDVNINLDDFKI